MLFVLTEGVSLFFVYTLCGVSESVYALGVVSVCVRSVCVLSVCA